MNDSAALIAPQQPSDRAKGPAPAPVVWSLAAPVVLAAAVLAFVAHPLGGRAVVAGIVAALAVLIAASELFHSEIPDRIFLLMLAAVFAGRIAFGPQQFVEYAIAAAAAGTGMLIPRVIDRKAVGVGDVKFTVLIGGALGWSTAWAIAIAFLCLFPVAVVVVARGGWRSRGASVPLSPFLALGTLVVLILPLFGTTLR